MKSFNEFIGESELDPLAELPELASIRDAELAKPRDPEESIRWFNGFKSFLLSQLQITSLSDIVEIAPGHSRFEDMLAQAEKDRSPWGRKKSLGHYFQYYNNPVKYLSMLSGDFGTSEAVFWISREEYEKKFGIGTELDSLTSFIGESVTSMLDKADDREKLRFFITRKLGKDKWLEIAEDSAKGEVIRSYISPKGLETEPYIEMIAMANEYPMYYDTDQDIPIYYYKDRVTHWKVIVYCKSLGVYWVLISELNKIDPSTLIDLLFSDF